MPQQRSGGRLRRAAVVVGAVAVVAALIASATVSVSRWTGIWTARPTQAWITRFVAQVHSDGLLPSLWDVPAPSNVVTTLEPRYARISSILAVAGTPAVFVGDSAQMRLVSPLGVLTVAKFTPVVKAVAPDGGNPVCARVLAGGDSITVPLASEPQPADWFVQIGYWQQFTTRLTVTAHDSSGQRVATPDGDTVDLRSSIGHSVVPLGLGRPVSITLTNQTPGSNVCVASLAIGLPKAVTP